MLKKVNTIPIKIGILGMLLLRIQMPQNSKNINNFLRLDTTNDPLTGDLEIYKADPEMRLTDRIPNNAGMFDIFSFRSTSR